jgi:hypothetical protein
MYVEQGFTLKMEIIIIFRKAVKHLLEYTASKLRKDNVKCRIEFDCRNETKEYY